MLATILKNRGVNTKQVTLTLIVMMLIQTSIHEKGNFTSIQPYPYSQCKKA